MTGEGFAFFAWRYLVNRRYFLYGAHGWKCPQCRYEWVKGAAINGEAFAFFAWQWLLRQRHDWKGNHGWECDACRNDWRWGPR